MYLRDPIAIPLVLLEYFKKNVGPLLSPTITLDLQNIRLRTKIEKKKKGVSKDKGHKAKKQKTKRNSPLGPSRENSESLIS